MSADQLIQNIAAQLQRVPGIQAIVLGGSRARGTHTADSDVDLGLYYHPESPVDLTALERAARSLDDEHRGGLVTEIGGWGPWINGGGWLKIGGVPVDFLYRDLGKVARIIAACQAGEFEMAYQPGHPHGFASYIYMGEIALCRPLWDPQGAIAGLKARAAVYPPELQRAIIARFRWEAGFSLGIARKSIGRGDVLYAAGCCFRAAMCLLQTLFALNEQYWLNEKGAVALAASFPICPPELQPRIEAAFGQLAASPEAIGAAIAQLDGLLLETESLVAQ